MYCDYQKMPETLHVVVVDLPGHGGSSMPGVHDEVSIEEYVNNIHEVKETSYITKLILWF